jgi:predicted AAA+ superfamily ATPase
LRVRERKLPKLYWCDPGIVRSVKRAPARVAPEERGALFEGLVAQTIRAYRDYRGICDEFYYWAPLGSSDTEVDFLLAGADGYVAVEAKAGRQFNRSWCRGLRAIEPLPGLRRRLVVHPGGPELKTEDGIEVLSFASFASMLANETLWR